MQSTKCACDQIENNFVPPSVRISKLMRYVFKSKYDLHDAYNFIAGRKRSNISGENYDKNSMLLHVIETCIARVQ